MNLEELRAWVESAPAGTMIPADQLGALLGELAEVPRTQAPRVVPDAPTIPTWRALLWTVDPETRIGRDELLEAVGRPVSWLYRHTGEAGADRMPHRKLDGQLVFVVGEVRRWLRDREEIVVGGSASGSGSALGLTGSGR